MLRTRTKRNNDTIKGSGSAFKGGIKGKHHSQRKKQILNLFIGFAIVFLVGLFFSLFVYDIDDLENASSFHTDGKGKLDDAHDESGRKRRNREEEKEKEKNRSVKSVEKEEEHSTRSHGRNGSRFGSAVAPNARFDTRSSFAQSSFALSKGNGRSFPYRYVFVPVLFARLLRLFND